jgi:hypothetical protein
METYAMMQSGAALYGVAALGGLLTSALMGLHAVFALACIVRLRERIYGQPRAERSYRAAPGRRPSDGGS